MLKTWPVIFRDFLADRTGECQEKLLERDEKYGRLYREYRELLDRLSSSLGENEFQLFLDCEAAGNSLMDREDELIYRQGLFDGLRLGYFLDGIRRGDESIR